MDEFEHELKQALERRPAPPGLKRRTLARRNQRRAQRFPRLGLFQWGPATAFLAALILVVVIVAAGVGEIFVRRQAEERRKGEAAREQVLIALRITGHALDEMKAQLAEHNRNGQE